MKLVCNQLTPFPLEIVPARQERAWMENSPQRFAYRCLPLTVANTAGWELLCPMGFEAEWDGGSDKTSLRIFPDDPAHHPFATSHFGCGIITIHPGWLFETDPGVNLLVQGSPNYVRDGVQALTGLVESDWLSFSFTMNWIMTRPGRVRFEKGDPLCFITLMRPAELTTVQPIARKIEQNPPLHKAYIEWRDSRAQFMQGLSKQDPDVVKAGWQKNYHLGRAPSGALAPDTHVSKRKMKPLQVDPDPPQKPPLFGIDGSAWGVGPSNFALSIDQGSQRNPTDA